MSSVLPPGQPGQPQSSRLTEEEAKAVTRLLSDPTYFPVEFRAWIKNFIETSGITLPASQIKGGGTGARTGLPAGMVIAYPIAAVPPDALQCDGRAVVRTDFQKLWELLGTTWGAGDGATTFNIPDFRDRALYGIGGVVGLTTDGVAFGLRGGPNHHHHMDFYSNVAGYHSHSGSTSWGGDHDHNMGTGHGTRSDINHFQSIEYPGGGAMTSVAGGHDHGLTTNATGDHQHQIAGDTQGGYDLKPSWAGIVWAITTGL